MQDTGCSGIAVALQLVCGVLVGHKVRRYYGPYRLSGIDKRFKAEVEDAP